MRRWKSSESGPSKRNHEEPSKRNHEELSLLGMPEDIISKILAINASGNIRDHFRCLSVSKKMASYANDTNTLHDVDLIKVHIPTENHWQQPQGVIDFRQSCLDASNPTAEFLKGISDFLYTEERDEGFERIKRAAKQGVKVARYAYEIIRRSIAPELDVGFKMPQLSRGGVRYLRRAVVECARPKWAPSVSYYLFQINNAVDIDLVSTCHCAVHYDWLDWWHKNVKGLGMCDACFWAIETAVFFRIVPQAFGVWNT